MAELLNNQIFRMLNLEIHTKNGQNDLEKIAVLSTGNHAACHAARDLFIGSLVEDVFTTEKTELPWRSIQPDTVSRDTTLTHLFNAIASLKGDVSVK